MNWYHFDNVHISIGVPLRWELPGTTTKLKRKVSLSFYKYIHSVWALAYSHLSWPSIDF